MKKTKKILSLILAIIMIVSTMPMAFAYSYDYDAYVDAYIDFIVNTSNVYTSEDMPSVDMSDFVYYGYAEVVYAVEEKYPGIIHAFGDPDALEAMPEAADALTAALNEVSDTIDKGVELGNLTLVIDTRKAISSYYKIPFTYTEEELEAFFKNIDEKSELILKAGESAKACDDLLAKAHENPGLYTQDDYDAAAADMIAVYTQISNCLDGNHDNTYANGGADTHTATCAFCTETSTATHSYTNGACVCGAKAPDNNTQEEPVKQNFFQKIISTIKDFFNNLFNNLFGWIKF